MSEAQTTRSLKSAGGGAIRPANGVQVSSIQTLLYEKQMLRRELDRCYEQLGAVFDITAHVSTLSSAPAALEALFRRYARLLSAAGLYQVSADTCRRCGDSVIAAEPAPWPAEALQAQLQAQICEVRRASPGRPAFLVTVLGDAFDRAQVLLGGLCYGQPEADVLIAVRSESQPPFDQNDRHAAETLLVYGGHIVCSLRAVGQVQEAAIQSVAALASLVDARDHYTAGHSERVGWLARQIGEALALDDEHNQRLEWAGVLHDVGKLGVSEEILNKPGELTDGEFEQMKRHPRLSYEVLKPVQGLAPILEAVLYHHENHDGSGYPNGLAGAAIPLDARIVHVADIFDALTSERPYRAGMPLETALSVIAEGAGTVTDPHVSDVFLRTIRSFARQRPEEFEQRFPHIRDVLSTRPRAMPATADPIETGARTILASPRATGTIEPAPSGLKPIGSC